MGVQPNQDRNSGSENDQSNVQRVIRSLKTQLFAESVRKAESCVICLDKFQPADIVAESTCKSRHLFHSHYLTEWLH